MEQPPQDGEVTLASLLARGLHSWEDYSALRVYLDAAAFPDPSQPYDCLEQWQVRVECAESLVEYTESTGLEKDRPKILHVLYHQLVGLRIHQLALAQTEGSVELAQKSLETAEAMDRLVTAHPETFGSYAPWVVIVGSLCCAATLEPPSRDPYEFLRKLCGQFEAKDLTKYDEVLSVASKELYENARKLLNPLPGKTITEQSLRTAILLLETVDCLGLPESNRPGQQTTPVGELLASAKSQLNTPPHQ